MHIFALNVWGGGGYIIDANQAGKRANSLFNCTCISVTDDIKINEQNNPIVKRPLYLVTDLSIPTESYGEFEPLGVSDIAILTWSMLKTPKCTLP